MMPFLSGDENVAVREELWMVLQRGTRQSEQHVDKGVEPDPPLILQLGQHHDSRTVAPVRTHHPIDLAKLRREEELELVVHPALRVTKADPTAERIDRRGVDDGSPGDWHEAGWLSWDGAGRQNSHC